MHAADSTRFTTILVPRFDPPQPFWEWKTCACATTTAAVTAVTAVAAVTVGMAVDVSFWCEC